MTNCNEKKTKNKTLKIELSSESDSSDSVHELSYYMKDKVKLMKEVLKLIKPKKIKSMAPDCIKHLDIAEINSMLLEELLGISNKRLQYIFNGENVDRETSSSDSDDEKKPVDIISLDDISDDDIEITVAENEKGQSKQPKLHKRSHKIKTESSTSEKKPKLEEKEQEKSQDDLKELERQNLMNVLELLELQARARAIKSQLALEANKQSTVEEVEVKHEDDSDPDAVIIESPEHKEIVLTSDSEDDVCREVNRQKKEKDVTAINCANTQENVIVLDDDKEKTENSKTDNVTLHLQKQKFLSKVKKIKLNRRRELTYENRSNETNENSKQKPVDIVTFHTNLQLSKESCVDHNVKPDTVTENIKNAVNTNERVLINQTQIEKTEDNQNANTNQSLNNENNRDCNEIDNDEIVVINLDEDEMKGIEND